MGFIVYSGERWYSNTRDGKSVNKSTDEYFVPKNSTKTRISRQIAICAKTALIPLN